MTKAKTIEQTYQKKTQHEHILSLPDMYIGTVEPVTEEVWVLDEADQIMKQRRLTWIPGLYKIFDEILVNAADNKVRDPDGQTKLMVTIDEAKGMVRVWNNGEGIPVAKHKEHNMWVPEMIFGHLMTSSNYEQGEVRVTGGRNGYGAKLTNVFSRRFEVETRHSRSRKKFAMTWTNNMLQPSEPQITSCESTDRDYTQITYYPDFQRFGASGFTEDLVLLMKRRVYDIAGCTPASMKCYLNGQLLPVTNFTQYVDLYPTLGEERKAASYSRVNDRWEICVRVSNIGYQQISFVNSIATTLGGTHVRYITDQVIAKVVEQAKKKAKTEVKAHMVKPHLWVFVNCLIENPSFDSQTKETLNTPRPKFGSSCDLPTSIVDYILKSGVVDRAVMTANSKLTKDMQAKLKTPSRSTILGIPKLEDANDAGGPHGRDCTLILTEGDSAKSLCMAGLGVVGKDRFGVFPLRGKPLNVRDASIKKVAACAEIQAVLKIMGLDIRRKYTDTSGLRYGHIMIMSDQDYDGSHIKGLIINFIHHYWPELCHLPGFLQQFITPIVRVTDRQGHKTSFYSMPRYLEWKASVTPQQMSRLSIRYYKGLGTSNAEDGREYFSQIQKHRLNFVRRGEDDDERIIMAFAKDKIEERKHWITAYKSSEPQLLDYTQPSVRYRDFVDKELILFSIADCERSIPSVVDGLKPGQRKILFSCFKRNLTKAIKVAQLAGYVSEQSAYHHGEASLVATIVGLAQDYVGANNAPLLAPDGQFGSRLAGGKDHAAGRYIFTRLSDLARLVFHKDDDYVVEYKDDDGLSVEPHHYVPIVPMVLVNGTSGIGTGFATAIPNYSPLDVIDNLRRLMREEDVKPMVPWYYGFTGTVFEKEKGKFVSRGVYHVQPNGVVSISELPIGCWTNTYKKFIEELMEKDMVLQFRENNSDVSIEYDIMLHPEVLREWQTAGVLEEKLGLQSYLHATNIIAFNIDGQLTKYRDAEAVLKEFFGIRMDYYGRRKAYVLNELRTQQRKLANMVRFVMEVIEGTLIITRRPKKDILAELKAKRYDPFPPQQKKKVSQTTIDEETNDVPAADDDNPDSPELASLSKDYDYLLGMRLWSLTFEMVQRLQKQLENAKHEADVLEGTSTAQLWLRDLDKLEASLRRYFSDRDAENRAIAAKRPRKRNLDVSRIRIPILSDKVRAAISKDDKKSKAPKTKTRNVDSDIDIGDSSESGGEEKKAKPRRAPRKRNTKDDTGDEAPKPTRSRKKVVTTTDGEADAPPKRQRRLDDSSPATKRAPVPVPVDDEDDLLLLGMGSTMPAVRTSPAPVAARVPVAAAPRPPAKRTQKTPVKKGTPAKRTLSKGKRSRRESSEDDDSEWETDSDNDDGPDTSSDSDDYDSESS